jgi:diguanylate cyclase (GGDEF)-like protein
VLRESDCLARWGGEEFALLAPGLDRAGAEALGERARRALADDPIDVRGVQIQLTLSVGVALAAGGRGSPDALIGAADQALYEAKSAGRNCVRVWDAAAQPAG